MTVIFASRLKTAMRRSFPIFIISLLLSTLSYGQKIGVYYISIPSDSAINCRLKFLSDTTIELSNVPRHMSGRLSLTFKYHQSDTTITIFTDKTSTGDKDWLTRFGYSFFFKSNIRLTIIKDGYLDYENSLIYVEQKKPRGNYKLAYIIEGKTYIQDIGQTDGYGLIKKKPKRNRRLEKRLTEISNNPDTYNLEFLKGLRAYQKVGLKYVPGVIIINGK